MTVGNHESNSILSFSRLILLLIIFHLISADQTANAKEIPGNDRNGNDEGKNIVENPIQLAFTTVSSNCFNSSDGSIDVFVTGGVEPYTFLWSDSSIAEDLLLVKAGIYTVKVIDAIGNSQSGTAVIEAPEEFKLKSEIIKSTENSSKIFIDVQLNGGTAPYKYSWSNGENTSMLSTLIPGVYSLTYTDINGCEGNFKADIYQLSDMSLSNKIDISQPQ